MMFVSKAIFHVLFFHYLILASWAAPFTHYPRHDIAQSDDPSTSTQPAQDHAYRRSPQPHPFAPAEPAGHPILNRRGGDNGISMFGGKHKEGNKQFDTILNQAHSSGEAVTKKSWYGRKKEADYTHTDGRKYRFHYGSGLHGARLKKVSYLDDDGKVQATTHHKSSWFSGKLRAKENKVQIHKDMDAAGGKRVPTVDNLSLTEAHHLAQPAAHDLGRQGRERAKEVFHQVGDGTSQLLVPDPRQPLNAPPAYPEDENPVEKKPQKKS